MRTPFGYAGQYTDAETGLQYLRARYYDPATAQFLTRDPLIGVTGRPYAYTFGNPLDQADPSGRCPWCIVMIVGGAVGAVVGGGIVVATDLLQRRAIDWGQVGMSAGTGLVAGATFGLAAPVVGGAAAAVGLEGTAAAVATAAGAGAVSGVAGTAAAYALDPRARQAGVGGVAQGAVVGAVGGVAGYALHGLVTAGLDALGGLRAGVPATTDSAATGEAAPRGDTPGCEGCFAAGTMVATARGERAIETLHVGDMVLSENPTTHTLDREPLERVLHDPRSPLVVVDLSDGSTITTTATHSF